MGRLGQCLVVVCERQRCEVREDLVGGGPTRGEQRVRAGEQVLLLGTLLRRQRARDGVIRLRHGDGCRSRQRQVAIRSIPHQPVRVGEAKPQVLRVEHLDVAGIGGDTRRAHARARRHGTMGGG